MYFKIYYYCKIYVQDSINGEQKTIQEIPKPLKVASEDDPRLPTSATIELCNVADNLKLDCVQ